MKAKVAGSAWTTAADLRTQVQRMWDTGALLAELAPDRPPATPDLFPRRLKLRKPTSTELVDCFAEVQAWIADLERGAKHYRLVWRSVNHRVLGANSVPAEAWVDSPDDAISLIGKRGEAERFAAVAAQTNDRQPGLIPWLVKRPLRALELADDWAKMLDLVDWLRHNPRPGIYLRQVDIPAVHSKFIENCRAVLGELFDLALPAQAIDETAGGGVGAFCRRYGFLDKPVRVRFRILDSDSSLLGAGTDQDITLTHSAFARLDPPVTTVFITENEINFLAFPSTPRSMVVFGAGYGFEILTQASWLRDRAVYYWGDLDTHGFAILNQFRAQLPQIKSFLMERGTLLAHKTHWGVEPQPETRDLDHLTAEEHALYDDLRYDRLGERVRLEQEKIGFEWIRESLEKLDI